MRMTAKPRPRNLGLLHMRQPIGAWASITHRVTGVLLVLALPVVLYALDLSLSSPAGFDRVKTALHAPLPRVAMTLVLWVFAQHFCSGIRHLLLDLDIGITPAAARRSAGAVFVVAILVTVLLGAGVIW